MSDYSQINDYSAKDALTTGDPNKLILGADIDGELAAIATAVTSKYDSTDLATQAQAEDGNSSTTLLTPLRQYQRDVKSLGCVVGKSGSQNVLDSLYTAITWDTETYDQDGWHSTVSNTSRFTVPDDTDYAQFGVNIDITATVNNQMLLVRLYKNGLGQAVYTGASSTNSNGPNRTHFVTPPIAVSAGDYFEWYVLQTTGGATDVTNESHAWAVRCA